MSVNAKLARELSKSPCDPDYPGVLPCQKPENGLYPNVDLSIWLRSCTKETEVPLAGTITGRMPSWLGGNFLQNGPGKMYFGSQTVQHLFDGAGLLQKYMIEKGQVYYQCRYIRSKNFQKNLDAQKVMTNEFATPSSDPKRLNNRLTSITDLSEMMSDNCFITVNPLGDDYFCFYESPFVQQVDPDTLETLRNINLNTNLGILTNASHPHYDDHGNMLSLGMKIGRRGPEYIVRKTVPRGKELETLEPDKSIMESVDHNHILTEVRVRFVLDPSYMHSFAMTPRYFILIEQPLTVNVPKLARNYLRRKPIIGSLRWRREKGNSFYVVDRVTGEKTRIQYRSQAFFFLHTINAFEVENHLVVDICCYDKPDMLECMMIEKLQIAQTNEGYAQLFEGRPQRFVLPLSINKHSKGNLVDLKSFRTEAKAFNDKNGNVHLVPEQICDVGCETPTIFYERFNGKEYRYFYAITSDVDDVESAGKIYKVDTLTKEVKCWYEPNTYCAEPMFIPNPDSADEDDGLIISSMIKGRPDVKYTALLVLDARTMKEIARAEFKCEGPVPKPLHGFFTGNNVSQKRLLERLSKSTVVN